MFQTISVMAVTGCFLIGPPERISQEKKKEDILKKLLKIAAALVIKVGRGPLNEWIFFFYEVHTALLIKETVEEEEEEDPYVCIIFTYDEVLTITDSQEAAYEEVFDNL